MGFKVKVSGDFSNTETYFLEHRYSMFTDEELVSIAEYGLALFKSNTPSSSGKTANSWSYEITYSQKGGRSIIYHNSNIQNGLNIAILVDTGHATASGHYVSGAHYIDKTIEDLCLYIDKKK